MKKMKRTFVFISVFLAGLIWASCNKNDEPDWIEFTGTEDLDCTLAQYLAGDYIGNLNYFEITPDTIDTIFQDSIITAINMSSEYSCLLSLNGFIGKSVYIKDTPDSITGSARVEFKGDSIHYYFYQNPWVPSYPNTPAFYKIKRLNQYGCQQNC